MLRRLAWITLVMALLLSTSCGLKGPLYLPDQPANDADAQQNTTSRGNP